MAKKKCVHRREAAQGASQGRVQVGDTVIRTPITFEARGSRDVGPMRGKVVYVHPLGRFHVVEFGQLRESFVGVERYGNE